MPMTADALKIMAVEAIKEKWGESVGNAYAFAMFGGRFCEDIPEK